MTEEAILVVLLNRGSKMTPWAVSCFDRLAARI